MKPQPNNYDTNTLLVMAKNLGIKVEVDVRVVYAPLNTSNAQADMKKRHIVESIKRIGWSVQEALPRPRR